MQNALSLRVTDEERTGRPFTREAVEGPSRTIVEFVGLPGVGKSFLSRRLDEHFRRARVDEVETTPQADGPSWRSALRTRGKIARAVRFSALHPDTTKALASIVRSDGGGLGLDRLTKLINLLSELARSDRVPAATTLINGQGVLQAVWSLEMRADDSVQERLLHRCAEWLPDAVVFVEVDWRQNADRLRRRKDGHSRFDTLSDEQLDAEASKGSRRMRTILDTWAVIVPGARRLDFHNETDTDAKTILAWLDEVRDAGGVTASGERAGEEPVAPDSRRASRKGPADPSDVELPNGQS